MKVYKINDLFIKEYSNGEVIITQGINIIRICHPEVGSLGECLMGIFQKHEDMKDESK